MDRTAAANRRKLAAVLQQLAASDSLIVTATMHPAPSTPMPSRQSGGST